MAKVKDCTGFETFGADVKEARKAKNLARKDLAEKVNVCLLYTSGRGAGAAIALVVGAVEILDLRIALIEMKVKVAAAISADQQAGKHIVFSIVGAALTDFAPLLLHQMCIRDRMCGM